MTVRQINGLSELADRFDALILDLWGVIHDGVTAYPGVAETLAALQRAGKKTIMLSNAPRRADALVAQLSTMGIDRGLYGEVLSSGEAVYLELAQRTDPFYAGLGRRLYHMGPERDRNIFRDLPYQSTSLDEADFILNTGPWDLTETVEDYVPAMEQGIRRRLPMICANPDHVVLRQGARVVCAGALAARYEDMGGQVSWRGKPDPAIYAQAMAVLGVADPTRVLGVGDALHTDIKGGNGAGISTLLVTGGIHSSELGTRWGERADPVRLAELVRHHGHAPLAAVPTFVW